MSSSKFKSGDKVIIRLKERGTIPSLNDSQRAYQGQIVTLERSYHPGIDTSSNAWLLKEDSQFFWLEEHFHSADQASSKKKYPGDCPCGIDHRQCDYHKD